MSDVKLRGAAFHEAGHVIVARELGLPVGEIAVGIDGDHAKGRTDISSAHHLPVIDQIARFCLAQGKMAVAGSQLPLQSCMTNPGSRC
jgi:hypothetical protein